MKVGLLAEANPTLYFNGIVRAQLVAAEVRLADVAAVA